jgi:hypothetical protein
VTRPKVWTPSAPGPWTLPQGSGRPARRNVCRRASWEPARPMRRSGTRSMTFRSVVSVLVRFAVRSFSTDFKAGPAGGRLRRPSSAGNRPPPGTLGRRGLQHGLDPRQPLAPHLLTLPVQERIEHLKRADRIGVAPERHPRSPVRLLEVQVTLGRIGPISASNSIFCWARPP